MIEDIIWSSGAKEDYVNADSRLAPERDMECFLGLAKLFPGIGSPVSTDSRLRRGLIG